MAMVVATALFLCAVAQDSKRGQITEADVERWMNEISNWCRWGLNDEMGTVNLITPAKRREAAMLVKIGLSVSLAHDDSTEKALDNDPPFGHTMLTTGADPSAPFAMDRYTETYHGWG